jgi:ubiquinone/menaquinone biosynthesis C-methylase UbiE
VIGLDAADAMLEQGRAFMGQAGLENIQFQRSVVQDLPFEDETFEIVVPDESTGAEYDYYEWLCDQSHTRCLGFEEF